MTKPTKTRMRATSRRGSCRQGHLGARRVGALEAAVCERLRAQSPRAAAPSCALCAIARGSEDLVLRVLLLRLGLALRGGAAHARATSGLPHSLYAVCITRGGCCPPSTGYKVRPWHTYTPPANNRARRAAPCTCDARWAVPCFLMLQPLILHMRTPPCVPRCCPRAGRAAGPAPAEAPRTAR